MIKSLQHKLILASNSPRRKELLDKLGWPFEVRVKNDIDESYPCNLPPNDIAEFLATKKASVYELIPGELLITADTVVIVDNQTLGKPASREQAVNMLKLLSGKSHHVVTGVCLTTLEKQKTFSVQTEVEFKMLSADEIFYYVDTFKPYDKAGAYGIQEWIGYVGVTQIRGSYFNVMGLPVQRIYEEIQSF